MTWSNIIEPGLRTHSGLLLRPYSGNRTIINLRSSEDRILTTIQSSIAIESPALTGNIGSVTGSRRAVKLQHKRFQHLLERRVGISLWIFKFFIYYLFRDSLRDLHPELLSP